MIEAFDAVAPWGCVTHAPCILVVPQASRLSWVSPGGGHRPLRLPAIHAKPQDRVSHRMNAWMKTYSFSVNKNMNFLPKLCVLTP